MWIALTFGNEATIACCNPNNGLCVVSNALCTTQAGYTVPADATL